MNCSRLFISFNLKERMHVFMATINLHNRSTYAPLTLKKRLPVGWSRLQACNIMVENIKEWAAGSIPRTSSTFPAHNNSHGDKHVLIP